MTELHKKKRSWEELVSPEAMAETNRVIHSTYVTEGSLVAFPTCFPGASIPLPPQESRLTALDVAPDGSVYIGASGRQVHLLVGMFHGVTGTVFDMGVPENADSCTAIVCGEKRYVAAVNGPKGGRLVSQELEPLPYDLIQEWGFTRTPLDELGAPVAGERILHAVRDPGRAFLYGITERHLFQLDFSDMKMDLLGEIPGAGRLAIGSQGGLFGYDETDTLWRFDPTSGALSRRAVKLPEGRWSGCGIHWARDERDGSLYAADGEGRIFRFREDVGFSTLLAQTSVAPVGAMVVTRDGRLFGQCGEGIGRLFRYRPGDGEYTDLGVAVSVIQRRRYGYQFADAVTGRDGQVYFAENDASGHLWIYFPRIEPQG